MDQLKNDKNVISSAHINFLFGAGVNGRAFPQLNGFTKTIVELKTFLHKEIDDFEAAINELSSECCKDYVYSRFSEEFKEFEEKIDYSNKSLIHLSELFSTIYKIVEDSENRQRDMKQINIYTLNYDNIVENILDSLGFMNNSVSACNLGENIKFLDMVAYDYTTYKFMPTFMISKLHGDINKPIYPGINKYETSLSSEYFEINFRMKEQLCKYNSVLFVIGYSCNDKHINKILLDCMKHGLMIYWFKYSESDKILEECPEKQIIVKDNDYKTPQDTTLICSQFFKSILGDNNE